MKLRPKSLTTYYVRTDYVYMNITLSIHRSVISEARRRAKTLGTSVNQLVREYLEQFAGKTDPRHDVEEFLRLARESHGNSHGWKFNREELHDR
jgi:hypothetical protein